MTDLKELLLTFFSSSFLSLKEELGLARGLKIAESIWKRLAEDLFPIFNNQIKTEEDELASIVQFLAGIFKDVLGVEQISYEIEENSASFRLIVCPFWELIKQNKLPPATHNIATVFIETLARLKSPGAIFDKIGAKTAAQGSDYCEYVWNRF